MRELIVNECNPVRLALDGSVTDGFASISDRHQRWPNVLAERSCTTS
jgi:hypothetical protein